MKLLILLPAYNEEKTIGDIIKHVPSQISGIEKIEILVVDDGSSDQTREIAKVAGASVISHFENKGLGQSFQTGVNEALRKGYDIMVNIDADGQFNPEDIVKLIAPIVRNEADFVTASRFINKEFEPKMTGLKKWGNKKVSRLISIIARKKYYDVSCGFRAYSREALLNLNLFSKFTYTHETLLNIIFKDLRIIEMPIKVRGEREFGSSKIANSLWKYGYNIFNTIFRTILDYKPLKFFGWGGAILFGVGLLLDFFILGRLLFLGEITPFKSIGFGGLALNIFGLLLLIVGLLADMINKTRVTQERILYHMKKRMYQDKDDGAV